MNKPIDVLFPNLIKKIKGKSFFFFSDFDGTLAPIRRDPEKVVLSARVRRILQALTLRMPVAIISGRPLTYLKKTIDMPEIVLAGNHGLEIELGQRALRANIGKRKRFRHPQAISCQKTIHQLARRISRAFVGTKGARIEDKGLTLSFHYRSVVSTSHEAVFRTFIEIVKPFQAEGLLRVTRGKMCFEVRPNIDWGKEDAMRWILDAYQENDPEKSFLPVYMGDDETDKPAIALAKKNGISIFKGDPILGATYCVKSHEDIILFMRQLITECLAACRP